MPKKTKQELENLVQLITRSPNGLSTEELLQLMEESVPRRTVQYRLASLVKSGVLRTEGLGRSVKYYVNQEKTLKLKETEASYTIPPLEEGKGRQACSAIPYSQEAKKIQKLIAIPFRSRRPVGYQREFLETYEPNQTFYLTPSILEKLSTLRNDSDNGRPAGTYARKIYERLLLDLSWNSSRLEGNTYSLLETERLLSTGEGVPGRDWVETQMILNHKDAIEFIVDRAEEFDIERYTILNLQSFLSYGLLEDPKACGRLRKMPVRIGQSVYRPLEMPQLLEEYFQLIIQKASAIKNPFEQSFFLMVHLPYLQPFLDVNKRVSRLAGNIPFIRENLSPISFVDVPELDYVQGLLAIYELNRIELFRDVFVWAYERSALRYVATFEGFGPPDLLNIRYRYLIRQAVAVVVQKRMDKLNASQFIAKFARENIFPEDRARFIENAEIKVMSLHEGNFAPFKITLSELSEWQKGWK